MNKFWGRNEEASAPKFSRDNEQILALNYENLCDGDYLNRLFVSEPTPQQSNRNDQGASSAGESDTPYAHPDAALFNSDISEDLTVFGKSPELARLFYQKRFISELHSSLRVQDSITNLVNRQIVVFDHIGKLMLENCMEQQLQLQTQPTKQIQHSFSEGKEAVGSSVFARNLVLTTLSCTLKSMQKKTSLGKKRSSIYPILMLMMQIYQRNPDGSLVDTDLARCLEEEHIDSLRNMFLSGISQCIGRGESEHHHHPSNSKHHRHGHTHSHLSHSGSKNISIESIEEKLNFSITCSYGLLMMGLLRQSQSEMLFALSSMMCILAQAEFWQEIFVKQTKSSLAASITAITQQAALYRKAAAAAAANTQSTTAQKADDNDDSSNSKQLLLGDPNHCKSSKNINNASFSAKFENAKMSPPKRLKHATDPAASKASSSSSATASSARVITPASGKLTTTSSGSQSSESKQKIRLHGNQKVGESSAAAAAAASSSKKGTVANKNNEKFKPNGKQKLLEIGASPRIVGLDDRCESEGESQADLAMSDDNASLASLEVSTPAHHGLPTPTHHYSAITVDSNDQVYEHGEISVAYRAGDVYDDVNSPSVDHNNARENSSRSIPIGKEATLGIVAPTTLPSELIPTTVTAVKQTPVWDISKHYSSIDNKELQQKKRGMKAEVSKQQDIFEQQLILNAANAGNTATVVNTVQLSLADPSLVKASYKNNNNNNNNDNDSRKGGGGGNKNNNNNNNSNRGSNQGTRQVKKTLVNESEIVDDQAEIAAVISNVVEKHRRDVRVFKEVLKNLLSIPTSIIRLLDDHCKLVASSSVVGSSSAAAALFGGSKAGTGPNSGSSPRVVVTDQLGASVLSSSEAVNPLAISIGTGVRPFGTASTVLINGAPSFMLGGGSSGSVATSAANSVIRPTSSYQTGSLATSVWSSGQNCYGELGLTDATQRKMFNRVTTLDDKFITSIGAGNEHTAFVSRDGKLYTCGYNDNGQCGVGSTTQVNIPTCVTGLDGEDIAKVYVFNGCEHTIAVSRDGKIFSFGYNYRGQLGLGNIASETVPRPIRGLLSRKVVQVACSYHHSFMLCSDGSLFSAGRNDFGQLAHGDTVDKKTPQPVLNCPRGVTSISCGQFHSVLSTAAGHVYVSGKNDYGQLGTESTANVKILSKIATSPEVEHVAEVCCGYYHTLVLSSLGIVAGFGRNDYGQLGLGHTQPKVYNCTTISGLRDKSVVMVSCGCYHSAVVASNSMLYVFGRNNHGQLATGDLEERHSPHPVDNFVGQRILAVAAGFYHTVVLVMKGGAEAAAAFLGAHSDISAPLLPSSGGSNRVALMSRDVSTPDPASIIVRGATPDEVAGLVGAVASAASAIAAATAAGGAGAGAAAAQIPLVSPSVSAAEALMNTNTSGGVLGVVGGGGGGVGVGPWPSSAAMLVADMSVLVRLQQPEHQNKDRGQDQHPLSAEEAFSVRSEVSCNSILMFLIIHLETLTDTSAGDSPIVPPTFSTADSKTTTQSQSYDWLQSLLLTLHFLFEICYRSVHIASSLAGSKNKNNNGAGVGSKSGTEGSAAAPLNSPSALDLNEDEALSLMRKLINILLALLKKYRLIFQKSFERLEKLKPMHSEECGTDDNEETFLLFDASQYEHRLNRSTSSSILDVAQELMHCYSKTFRSNSRSTFEKKYEAKTAPKEKEADAMAATGAGQDEETAPENQGPAISINDDASAEQPQRSDEAPKSSPSRSKGDKMEFKQLMAMYRATSKLRKLLLYIYYTAEEVATRENFDNNALSGFSPSKAQQIVGLIALCVSRNTDIFFPSSLYCVQFARALHKGVLSVVSISSPVGSIDPVEDNIRPTPENKEAALETKNHRRALLHIRLLILFFSDFRKGEEVAALFNRSKMHCLQLFNLMLTFYGQLSKRILRLRKKPAVPAAAMVDRPTAVSDSGAAVQSYAETTVSALFQSVDVRRLISVLEHGISNFIKCVVPFIFSCAPFKIPSEAERFACTSAQLAGSPSPQKACKTRSVQDLAMLRSDADISTEMLFSYGTQIIQDVLLDAESVLEFLLQQPLSDDLLSQLKYGTVMPSILPSILIYGIAFTKYGCLMLDVLPNVKRIIKKLQLIGKPSGTSKTPGGSAAKHFPLPTSGMAGDTPSTSLMSSSAKKSTTADAHTTLTASNNSKNSSDGSSSSSSLGGDEVAGNLAPSAAAAAVAAIPPVVSSPHKMEFNYSCEADERASEEMISPGLGRRDAQHVSWWVRLLKLCITFYTRNAACLIYTAPNVRDRLPNADMLRKLSQEHQRQRTYDIDDNFIRKISVHLIRHHVWKFCHLPNSASLKSISTAEITNFLLQNVDARVEFSCRSSSAIKQQLESSDTSVSSSVSEFCDALRTAAKKSDHMYRMLSMTSQHGPAGALLRDLEETLVLTAMSGYGRSAASVSTASSAVRLDYAESFKAIARVIKMIHSKRSVLLGNSVPSCESWPDILTTVCNTARLLSRTMIVADMARWDFSVPLPVVPAVVSVSAADFVTGGIVGNGSFMRRTKAFLALRRSVVVIICMSRWRRVARAKGKRAAVAAIEFVMSSVYVLTDSLTLVDPKALAGRISGVISELVTANTAVSNCALGIAEARSLLDDIGSTAMKCDVIGIISNSMNSKIQQDIRDSSDITETDGSVDSALQDAGVSLCLLGTTTGSASSSSSSSSSSSHSCACPDGTVQCATRTAYTALKSARWAFSEYMYRTLVAYAADGSSTASYIFKQQELQMIIVCSKQLQLLDLSAPRYIPPIDLPKSFLPVINKLLVSLTDPQRLSNAASTTNNNGTSSAAVVYSSSPGLDDRNLSSTSKKHVSSAKERNSAYRRASHAIMSYVQGIVFAECVRDPSDGQFALRRAGPCAQILEMVRSFTDTLYESLQNMAVLEAGITAPPITVPGNTSSSQQAGSLSCSTSAGARESKDSDSSASIPAFSPLKDPLTGGLSPVVSGASSAISFSAAGKPPNKDSNSKRRCQDLITKPMEFSRDVEGLIVQGEKLINNYKSLDFSIALWVLVAKKSSSVSSSSSPSLKQSFITGKISHNDAWPLVLLSGENKVEVYCGHNNDFEIVISDAVIPQYVWTHIAVVVEQKKLKLFINGVLDKQVTTSKSNGRASLFPILIGTCPASLRTRVSQVKEGFDGFIAQYRYYSRALSPIHIKVIHDGGPPESKDLSERAIYRCIATMGALVALLDDSEYSLKVLSDTANTLQTLFVSELCGRRIRFAALEILGCILRLNKITDLQLTPHMLMLPQHAEMSKQSMSKCRFLGSANDFLERFVLYAFRMIGACWVPYMMHSAPSQGCDSSSARGEATIAAPDVLTNAMSATNPITAVNLPPLSSPAGTNKTGGDLPSAASEANIGTTTAPALGAAQEPVAISTLPPHQRSSNSSSAANDESSNDTKSFQFVDLSNAVILRDFAQYIPSFNSSSTLLSNTSASFAGAGIGSSSSSSSVGGGGKAANSSATSDETPSSSCSGIGMVFPFGSAQQSSSEAINSGRLTSGAVGYVHIPTVFKAEPRGELACSMARLLRTLCAGGGGADDEASNIRYATKSSKAWSKAVAAVIKRICSSLQENVMGLNSPSEGNSNNNNNNSGGHNNLHWVDAVGLSIVVGGGGGGSEPYLGSQVGNFFGSFDGQVLSINSALNSAVVMSWSSDHIHRQITRVRSTDLLPMPKANKLDLSLLTPDARDVAAPAIVSLLSTLSTFVPLILSDFLCLSRPDSPTHIFQFKSLLRSLRPLELLVFSQLLESITSSSSEVLTYLATTPKNNHGSNNPEPYASVSVGGLADSVNCCDDLRKVLVRAATASLPLDLTTRAHGSGNGCCEVHNAHTQSLQPLAPSGATATPSVSSSSGSSNGASGAVGAAAMHSIYSQPNISLLWNNCSQYVASTPQKVTTQSLSSLTENTLADFVTKNMGLAFGSVRGKPWERLLGQGRISELLTTIGASATNVVVSSKGINTPLLTSSPAPVTERKSVNNNNNNNNKDDDDDDDEDDNVENDVSDTSGSSSRRFSSMVDILAASASEKHHHPPGVGMMGRHDTDTCVVANGTALADIISFESQADTSAGSTGSAATSAAAAAASAFEAQKLNSSKFLVTDWSFASAMLLQTDADSTSECTVLKQNQIQCVSMVEADYISALKLYNYLRKTIVSNSRALTAAMEFKTGFSKNDDNNVSSAELSSELASKKSSTGKSEASNEEEAGTKIMSQQIALWQSTLPPELLSPVEILNDIYDRILLCDSDSRFNGWAEVSRRFYELNKFEVTQSLAMGLRYAALSLLQPNIIKRSENLLESSDLFKRCLRTLSCWMEFVDIQHQDALFTLQHQRKRVASSRAGSLGSTGSSDDCVGVLYRKNKNSTAGDEFQDVMYHILRILLPTLCFIESQDIEHQMMQLCMRIVRKLVLRVYPDLTASHAAASASSFTLDGSNQNSTGGGSLAEALRQVSDGSSIGIAMSGDGGIGANTNTAAAAGEVLSPSKALLDLMKSNNFTLLRARAQEQVIKFKDHKYANVSPLAYNLVQLVIHMEILQRQGSALKYQEAQTAFTKALTKNGRGPMTGKMPPPNTIPSSSSSSSSSSVSAVPPCVFVNTAASQQRSQITSLSLKLLASETAKPRVTTVRSGSADVDLTACAQTAAQMILNSASSSSGMFSFDNDDATASAEFASAAQRAAENIQVEVAICCGGVEGYFETVYCGTSLRCVQSGLAPDCTYYMRCRAYCGPALPLGWSQPVEFRTESGLLFTFDAMKTGPDVLLSDDYLTASYAGDELWSTVLGTRSFCSGITSWEIRINQSSTAYVFVGVAASAADLSTFLGGCHLGWGFIGEQALYHNREKVKIYGEAFNAGDIVGVTLNMNEGTLSFSRNRKSLGVAFDRIYGELFPAVAFYNVGQELEILSTSFKTTCPCEPIPVSASRSNMDDLSLLGELILSVQHRHPLSYRLANLTAEHCAQWCGGGNLFSRVRTVAGRSIYLAREGPLLKRFNLVVGERVRTPYGVAEVAGSAYGRLWFHMQNSSTSAAAASGGTQLDQTGGDVWFFSNQQLLDGRAKKLFLRCSYCDDTSSIVRSDAPPPSSEQHETGRALSIAVPSTPLSGCSVVAPSSMLSPASASASSSTANSNTNTPAANATLKRSESFLAQASSFDAASIQELTDPTRWSAEMDDVLLNFLSKQSSAASSLAASAAAANNNHSGPRGTTAGPATPATPSSPWTVTSDSIADNFRSLQQQLTRVMLSGTDGGGGGNAAAAGGVGASGGGTKLMSAFMSVAGGGGGGGGSLLYDNARSGGLGEDSTGFMHSSMGSTTTQESATAGGGGGGFNGTFGSTASLNSTTVSFAAGVAPGTSDDSNSLYATGGSSSMIGNLGSPTTGSAMKDREMLSHRWGISGPKRKAVVARMALLRLLNQMLDIYCPFFIADVASRGFNSDVDKSTDDFCPIIVSLSERETMLTAHSVNNNEDNIIETFPASTLKKGSAAVNTAISEGSNSLIHNNPWPPIHTSWSSLRAREDVQYGPLHSIRRRIFAPLKLAHINEVLKKSASRYAKTEDEYDYPEDLPHVRINRIKAFRAREASELFHIAGEDLVLSSMFCQLWREMRRYPTEKLRICYTHPMDDGQSRTFKIKFDGEGVDDYGGPYREVFQQICEELQRADPSVAGAAANDSTSSTSSTAARQQQQESRSGGGGGGAPVRCFLPLLLPTPNWTAVGDCTERYLYTFHPAPLSALKTDLFVFLGQLAGIALRSKITLDLALPSYIWKCLVCEPLTERDIASFDYPAYEMIHQLADVNEKLTSLSAKYIQCSHLSTAGAGAGTGTGVVLSLDDSNSEYALLRMTAEELVADLNWTFIRCDGQVIELVPGGTLLPVTVEDIPEYLDLYVAARLSESQEQIILFRRGFVGIVPESALSLLNWEELQNLICGQKNIDIARLRENTEYDDDVSADDPHVQFFWEVLESFSEEEKSSFLRFVWARPTLPPKGTEFSQKMRVLSSVGDEPDMQDKYLPKAHTCFFSINLPRYSSKELMAEKIRYAIFNCSEMDADFRTTEVEVAGWGSGAAASQADWQ